MREWARVFVCACEKQRAWKREIDSERESTNGDAAMTPSRHPTDTKIESLDVIDANMLDSIATPSCMLETRNCGNILKPGPVPCRGSYNLIA